jgi:ribosomal protein S18 acetylase RimI-like enzyme
MIDKYLERGDMFVLCDDDLKAICVVTNEGKGIFEIKNIATVPKYQGQGYGKQLVNYLFEHYRSECSTMLVGTGDSPATIPFYQKCGFVISHRIKDFFIDNYDHPIFEGGKQLTDMVYLKNTYPINKIAIWLSFPILINNGYQIF